ncbi:MAG: RelA/SpoT domain-containing protein [Gemmobacter sp.]|jgi:ppGpp synthetase/RelA/SpoT-type nucleotidyltranferase|nr:RelA/SpoT domain-containing protein [Gemmobacter sp.]
MAWAAPEYKPEDVNSAGRMLAGMGFPASTPEAQKALEIINSWRASHAYPLNTFQTTLRRNAKKIEGEIIVSQRIKRLDSIHRKLTSNSSMRMTQMQGIAGCRVVFKGMKSIGELVKVYKASRFGHAFRGEKDYIKEPKSDGYRCHHLVYQ